MKIKTKCGYCGKVYTMSADYIGKTAQCKQCHNNFVMTAMPEGPPASSTAQSMPPQSAPFQGQTPPSPGHPGFPPQPPFGGSAAPVPPFGAPQTPPVGLPDPFQTPPPNLYGGGIAHQQAPGGYPPQAAPAPYQQPQTQRMPQYQQQPPQAPQPSSAAVDPSLQTVVCPKCKFTAGIPPVSKKVNLRCQECGKVFAVKPGRKSMAVGKKAPKIKSGSGEKKSIPPVLIALVVVLLVVAVLVIGPTLGIIPNLLPF